jgi:hypothetical protein
VGTTEAHPMKGYIQDQSIVLTEALPRDFVNGDNVEIILLKQTQTHDLALDQGYRSLAQRWDAIPDDVAMQLAAEFTEEDLAFAEANLVGYAQLFQAGE